MLEKVYIVIVEDENGESTQIHSVHVGEETAYDMARLIEIESGLLSYVEEHSVI